MMKINIKNGVLALLTMLTITGCGSEHQGVFDGTAKHVYSIDVTSAGPLSRGIPEASLPIGINVQYKATVTYTDKTVEIMTTGIKWETSNDNGSITQSGILRTEQVGDVIISATLDGIIGQAQLNITNARVIGLSVTPTELALPREKEQQYRAIASYNNYTTLDITELANWSSSNESVATINDMGLKKTLLAGETTVVATFQGVVSNEAKLKVYNQGGVVTWGEPVDGGDSSAVQSQLTNVQTIFNNSYTFAALKNDGTVVTWGNSTSGGDSSAVQSQLTNVQTIVGSLFTFAAIVNDELP